MHIKTKALVILEKKLNDDDRLLFLLTEDKGLISAYAKGAGKIKGSLVSSTELLCYSEFILFQKNEKYFVDKADSISIFWNIRKDLNKLSLAVYFCQILKELVSPVDVSDEYLRLTLNCLYFLDNDTIGVDILKPLFELRMLTLSGYMPNIQYCARCGELSPGNIYFSPNDGIIYCENCCDKLNPNLIEISPSVYKAMNYIIYSDIKKLFSFKLGEKSIEQLNKVVRAYLLAQIERMLPALTYYETFAK